MNAGIALARGKGSRRTEFQKYHHQHARRPPSRGPSFVIPGAHSILRALFQNMLSERAGIVVSASRKTRISPRENLAPRFLARAAPFAGQAEQSNRTTHIFDDLPGVICAAIVDNNDFCRDGRRQEAQCRPARFPASRRSALFIQRGNDHGHGYGHGVIGLQHIQFTAHANGH